MKPVFLSNLHHAYAQTDGTYAFPNSREGDMLKTAKREIEHAEQGIARLRRAVAAAEAAHKHACWNLGTAAQVAASAKLEHLTFALELVTREHD